MIDETGHGLFSHGGMHIKGIFIITIKERILAAESSSLGVGAENRFGNWTFVEKHYKRHPCLTLQLQAIYLPCLTVNTRWGR